MKILIFPVDYGKMILHWNFLCGFNVPYKLKSVSFAREAV